MNATQGFVFIATVVILFFVVVFIVETVSYGWREALRMVVSVLAIFLAVVGGVTGIGIAVLAVVP